MHQLYLLVLTLVLITTCAKSAASTEEAPGWFDEPQINTDPTLQDSSLYRKLERRVASKTEVENDEERVSLKSFLTVPNTLLKSPAVAKVEQERPDIAKVLKNKPEIGQTVRKMHKDKHFMEEVQRSPAVSRIKTSLRKNPSKTFSEAEVKRLGTIAARSIKSTGKWPKIPDWFVALSALSALPLTVIGLSIASNEK
ncbi:Putative RxLR effector [Phytophthora palmivora]|uniref:RxLR effector n=1 Tax=Phytophthora palmivora TaxID=4796 RepID=A0A2P4Y1I6_9STRA|nr:Putative RxLR effector [Phytophthora palmivora]